MDSLRYEVKKGEDGKPLVRLGEDWLRAEEVSGLLIRHMVNLVEAEVGEKVTNLVITVPANFNDAQRSATKDAAAICGLNVLRILSEPSAAALAYGLNRNTKVLVFDCGGGTLDISLVESDNGFFSVLGTHGNMSLGGERFVERMVAYVGRQLKRQLSDSEYAKIKRTCEYIKIELSSSE